MAGVAHTTKSIFVFLLSFVVINTSGYASEETLYYDNQEAAEIAQCIRAEIKRAPVPELKDLRLGEEWVCKQLMYLWDESFELSILVAREDGDRPFFKFVENQYTEADLMVDNAVLDDDKQTFGFFNVLGQSGYFSHTGYGMGPHRQDYLSFAKGYLFWEESLPNNPHSAKVMPDFAAHPLALYRNYATTPEKYKYRVTTYGVCYVKDSKAVADNAPCFK